MVRAGQCATLCLVLGKALEAYAGSAFFSSSSEYTHMLVNRLEIPADLCVSLTSLMQARSEVLNALSSYCSKRLRDRKYVSSSFRQDFNFRTSSETIIGRSVGRLATIVSRNLIKQYPHIAHLLRQGQQGPLVCAGGRRELRIQVFASDIDEVRSVLDRYLRFLEYKCRKTWTPLRLILDAPNREGDLGSIIIRALIICPTPVGQVSTREAYEEWLSSKMALAVEAGRHPDSVYADSTLWSYPAGRLTTRDFLHSTVPTLPVGSLYENLFEYMPEILRAIANITRKLSYASGAYTVGDGEAP